MPEHDLPKGRLFNTGVRGAGGNNGPGMAPYRVSSCVRDHFSALYVGLLHRHVGRMHQSEAEDSPLDRQALTRHQEHRVGHSCHQDEHVGVAV